MESMIDTNILIERYESHRQATSRGIQAKFTKDPEARANWGGAQRPDQANEDMTRGRKKRADSFALKRGKLAVELRTAGKSYGRIAKEYERRGIKTSLGKNTWNAGQIRSLIIRYKRLTNQS